VILYDDVSGRAELAAVTLQSLGYERLQVLQGGLANWGAARYATASGVNVPSKDFGERVHIESHVPELTPEELFARKARGERLIIWDMRTPEEYSRFSIPGSCNVPGGELIQHCYDLSQIADTTVVIHCAGRTRSIIGTQSLQRLGLQNVCALKNGTMGWLLAGLELEQRPNRQAPIPSPRAKSHAEILAAEIVQQEKIPQMSAQDLETLIQERTQRAFYLIDVRSLEEYISGHIPNSLSVPGGQAVQRSDDFIAVRAGTIVFACDSGARSVMAAYWYRKMGFKNVYVLESGLRSWVESGHELEKGNAVKLPSVLQRAQNIVPLISAQELAAILTQSQPVIIDVGKSPEYKSAHIPGARWLSRGWLELKVPTLFPDLGQFLVVTCPDGRQSALAGKSLQDLGYRNVFVLKDGVQSWIRGGRQTESGLAHALVEPNDVVIPASQSGDRDAMVRYLNWESELGEKYRAAKERHP
jgi:rhodanese-related sulfurtransferase